MKDIFAELIIYLQDSVGDYYYDNELCEDSLASTILAFANEVEKRIH